jgi:hypothetical protein
MALPDLNEEVMAIASLPKRMELAHWLVAVQGYGSVDDYWSLPEQYLYAKIAVSYGGPRDEASYISLPKNYAWSDIYNAITGGSDNHTDWCERQALGWILAASNQETSDLPMVSYYIDLPIKITIALLAIEGNSNAVFDDGIDTGYLLYDDGVDAGYLEFA